MRVGPATVTSQCTPKVLIPDASIAVACQAAIKNDSRGRMAVDWQAAAPNGQLQGQRYHKIVLPGYSVDIPAPPSGTEWIVGFVSMQEVTHAVEFAGLFVLATAVFAGIGVYTAGKHAAPWIRRHMRSMGGRQARRLR